MTNYLWSQISSPSLLYQESQLKTSSQYDYSARVEMIKAIRLHYIRLSARDILDQCLERVLLHFLTDYPKFDYIIVNFASAHSLIFQKFHKKNFVTIQKLIDIFYICTNSQLGTINRTFRRIIRRSDKLILHQKFYLLK